MKIYQVGGAVRDALLGRPVTEQDWVVVGAMPEELVRLGYKPVGKDFPVFIHPHTGEEYALARTERKVGRGYKGFVFHTALDVTLEQDLARRDLTINAIAKAETGELIDPFHGQRDLHDRVLRHVSPAFSEDPVRILRVARFAARYHALGFKIAPETRALMCDMVRAGEVDALVPERVWQEWHSALTEQYPAVFFEVLEDVGAAHILFPELNLTSFEILKKAAELTQSALIRFAVHMQESIKTLKKRYIFPSHFSELAEMVQAYHQDVDAIFSASAEEILKLLRATDAYRRLERFDDFLEACAVNAARQDERQTHYLREIARVIRDVRIESQSTGLEFGKQLEIARLTALQKFIEDFKS